MKRMWLIALTVCAVFSFTACSRKADNQETVQETEESANQQTTEAKEPVTTPAATLEAPGNTAEFKILTGKVTEVSDTLEDMTVKNGNTDVKLDLRGVVVETSFALEPDTEVSVIYKGEISQGDAANAKIVLVLDAQESMEVKSVTGSVKDQAMSTFTITLDDGEDMGFLKDNCEGLASGVLGQAADDSNGSGAMVKVTYVTVVYDAGGGMNFPLKVEAVE